MMFTKEPKTRKDNSFLILTFAWSIHPSQSKLITNRLIDPDGTMDLGAGPETTGVFSRPLDPVDPYSLDVAADADADTEFDTAEAEALLPLAAAMVDHTLVAALAHAFGHFDAGTVGLESYVGPKAVVFRADDHLASALCFLVAQE